MTVVEKSVLIHAGPDEIDAVTLDGNRFSEWYAGIESSTPDALYPEAGGVVNLIYRSAGINFNMTMTSLRLVRGQSLLLKMDGMITGRSRWRYEPEEGGTRVHCHFTYEMPGGSLGKAINKLVVERMNIENLEKSLNSLKTLVEGER